MYPMDAPVNIVEAAAKDDGETDEPSPLKVTPKVLEELTEVVLTPLLVEE